MITVRAMRSEEAGDVAALVCCLAGETRPGVVPKLTAADLIANADLIDVVIAAEEARVIGACLGLMTFSTWRGARGLYIVDLFVSGLARNRGIGLALLKESARRARVRGARFVKLEVDHVNDGAVRFYERLGFARHNEDRLFVLEEEGVQRLISSLG